MRWQLRLSQRKRRKQGLKKMLFLRCLRGWGTVLHLVTFWLGLVVSLGLDSYAAPQGAYKMDKHFLEEELEFNLPYILGLTRIWNRNILNLQSLAIVPYEIGLKYFPSWFQQ